MPNSVTSSIDSAAIKMHKKHEAVDSMLGLGARALGAVLVHIVTSMQMSKHFGLPAAGRVIS
jgi:hypothetical protein